MTHLPTKGRFNFHVSPSKNALTFTPSLRAASNRLARTDAVPAALVVVDLHGADAERHAELGLSQRARLAHRPELRADMAIDERWISSTHAAAPRMRFGDLRFGIDYPW
jgi:hypothetical protein